MEQKKVQDWEDPDIKPAYTGNCSCGQKKVDIFVLPYDEEEPSEDLIFCCRKCLPKVPEKRRQYVLDYE